MQATTSSHEQVPASATSTLNKQVSIKLDESNYHQWLQQVKDVLRGTKMVKYVVASQIIERLLFIIDCDSQIENHAYVS